MNPFESEHGEFLLSTKLFVPPLRPNRVSRPHLIALINAGLEKTLILVSAPAGYGKTSLVGSWMHESQLPASWLALDEGDNDPIRFLQSFIAALHQIIPTVQPALLSLVQGAHPAVFTTMLNILINEISAQGAPTVVILDDLHIIHTQAIFEMLTFMLEHSPPQLHLMLLSRTDPPLPLFRWRARDQLVEIRAEQLRFNREEITAFLNDSMGLKLSAEDILAMQARTEGWIAGLQLAALSLQGRKDIHSFVSAFTGSHHYVMDFLTEEVLKLQSESVRTFLLRTSILNSMCGSLCDAVVDPGNAEPIHGQGMLEALEAMNLFVIPLDDRRQWYRYHHLFAEVVSLRLEHAYPEQLPELHRRAAQWYEQHDMFFEATQHAISAGDQAHAAQMVAQNGCSLLMRGEGVTLLKWVESVSPYTQTHPWLSILKAWGLALTRQLDLVEPTLQSAEGLLSPLEPTDEVSIMRGNIAAVRAYMANLHEEAQLAAEHAQKALEYLTGRDDFSCSMRGVVTSIRGDASWISGNFEAARLAYQEAVQISRAAGSLYMTMIASSNLADVLFEQGELHRAARIYAETLEGATRPDGQELPLADSLFAGAGRIFYEWNKLDSAAGYVHRCIQLCQQYGNSDLLAQAYMELAKIERGRADYSAAQEALGAAARMLSEGRLSTTPSAWVKMSSAHWWIAEGDLERASRLVQQLGITTEDEISYPDEAEYYLLLRLLLAQNQYDAALTLEKGLLRIAESVQRRRRVIELLVLQALIYQGKKDMEQALAALGKAFSLAQAEGFVRVFIDEGEPLAKLLYQAKLRQVGGGYASELLSALGNVPGAELPAAQLLIEPLTLRELEVLELIEAGCTNQDIADRLVISIPTVKRHISNIYTKLGAESRTQAVSLGRELKLIK